MRIQGRVDVENIQIQLKDREIQAAFSAVCKGNYTHDNSEPYDNNGTGYPGWDGVDLDHVSVNEWVFFDEDGNEIELSDSEKKVAEKQMIVSVRGDESPIVWEYQ